MDIRIDTKFLSHPKTKKLLRRLGPEGVLSLLRLWLWAAENRPTGELHGLDSEDIDLISEWSDRPGAGQDQTDRRSFCQEAKELHWIDTSADGVMYLHEWALYNPWAADAPKRSDKARLSRLANVAPEAYLKLVREGRVSITKEEYREIVEASSNRQRPADARSTPAPSPAPTPANKESSEPEAINDRQRVLGAYHDFPGYKADLLYKENIWADSLIARFAGLDICEELEKARRWIGCREGFEVKNSRAYITKWLERVQKERS